MSTSPNQQQHQQQKQQYNDQTSESIPLQNTTRAAMMTTTSNSIKIDELYEEIAELLEKKRRHIFAIDDQIDITENVITLTRQERLDDHKVFEETMDQYTKHLKDTEMKIMSMLASLKTKAATIPKTAEEKNEMLIYKDAVQNKIDEDDSCGDDLDCSTSSLHSHSQRSSSKTPAFALSKQASLCRHVHVLTIHTNQLYLISRSSTAMVKLLECELRNQVERIYSIQLRLVNECISIETDIESMKTNFLSYLATFYCRVNRINTKDAKLEEEELNIVPKEMELHDEVEEFVGNHRSSKVVQERNTPTKQPASSDVADDLEDDMMDDIAIADVEMKSPSKNGSIGTVSTSEASTEGDDDEEIVIIKDDEEELQDCESVNLDETGEFQIDSDDDDDDDDDESSAYSYASSCGFSSDEDNCSNINPSESYTEDNESLLEQQQPEGVVVQEQGNTWTIGENVNSVFNRLSFSGGSNHNTKELKIAIEQQLLKG